MPDNFIPTIIPNPETSSTSNGDTPTTEKLPARESIPVVNLTSDTDDNTQQPPTASTAIQPIKNVVNKTKEPEILHKVSEHADSLTTIADQEEEEFIKEVMEEHKNNEPD